MLIDITFRHMDSSPRLRDHATERAEKLSRYFDQVQDVHIVLSSEKIYHIAEITVHTPGEVFKATSKSEDLYKSIDLTVQKLERHLKKRKEKVKVESHRA